MRSVVQPTTFNERKVEKANEGNRTPDRALTKRLLYRLSYVGKGAHYTKCVQTCGPSSAESWSASR